MTAQRPTFRVMKNGYDRFAVDDAVERYKSEIDQLEKKIAVYQTQLTQTNAQLEQMKAEYQNMVNSLETKTRAADDIARLSLREANDIINTAQANADEIIRESLSTARLILTDLSRLYNSAGAVKTDMSVRLEELMKELDNFQLPQMPDLRWLNEAEKKMR